MDTRKIDSIYLFPHVSLEVENILEDSGIQKFSGCSFKVGWPKSIYDHLSEPFGGPVVLVEVLQAHICLGSHVPAQIFLNQSKNTVLVFLLLPGGQGRTTKVLIARSFSVPTSKFLGMAGQFNKFISLATLG